MTTPHNHIDAPRPELAARRAATSLRNRLRFNTAFSLATGIPSLVFAGPIADLFDVNETWIFRALGAALIGFALGVLAISGTTTRTLTNLAAEVSIADFGWVVGTAVVIGLGWISTLGAIVLVAVAAVVLGIGVAQLRARRRTLSALATTSATLDESPPIEVHHYERTVRGTPDQLWPIITDHGLYARLALNLKAAENLTPNGPGFQRTCTDGVGRTWSETCTLWEDGRRFDIDVNIDDYPYPLQTMQGSWRVDPLDAATSTVAMTFVFQPEPGIAGRVFSPLMHLAFPPVLKRIARGWEAARSTAGAATKTGR